jgi:hypothetical protein
MFRGILPGILVITRTIGTHGARFTGIPITAITKTFTTITTGITAIGTTTVTTTTTMFITAGSARIRPRCMLGSTVAITGQLTHAPT